MKIIRNGKVNEVFAEMIPYSVLGWEENPPHWFLISGRSANSIENLVFSGWELIWKHPSIPYETSDFLSSKFNWVDGRNATIIIENNLEGKNLLDEKF